MNRVTRFFLSLVCAGMGLAAQFVQALPRSAPEAQGVSSAALLELVNTLDERIDGMHSLMIVRHGHVIAEGWWAPYDATHNHVLYSLSKSFTSTAVGFAVAEGRLSLDDRVLKFFPEAAPPQPSENLKAMRVRDLLTMSTGHKDEPPVAPDVISVKSFLAHPVPYPPGTHFKYNTPATFMLSAIVQKLTGQTVLEYLRPRLFEPLGITQPVWDTNFEGICLGGYGLRVRTEDIARFGQFYLQRGKWNGQQLLPAGWIAMATAKQIDNGDNPNSDWNQGYGFQFWRCRHNAYRGDGAFGQYCVIMPEQDTVVAITSGVKNMQAVLNVIWDKLLPALKPQTLPADAATHHRLKAKLASLEVPPAQGAATSPMAERLLNREFVFPANKQRIQSVRITLADSGKTMLLTARLDDKNITIPCGYQEWKKGRAPLLSGPLAQFPDEPIAGTFAWSADGALLIKLCAYETPYHLMLTLKLDGDRLLLDTETNVAFGPTKRPRLVGE